MGRDSFTHHGSRICFLVMKLTTNKETAVIFFRLMLFILFFLFCSEFIMADEKFKPYERYTGTVHQFGFITSAHSTENANYFPGKNKKTYRDYGLGVVYNLHDYITKQFTFEVVSSFTVMTSKCLGKDHQKITLPLECRFCLGPSEDFQAYLGTGFQYNQFERPVSESYLWGNNQSGESVCQLSGNTIVGLNILGPQNFMLHFNIGAKFHYPITDNDRNPFDPNEIDMANDKSCVILNGSLTLDLDKRKHACMILTYEYPLGTPHSRFNEAESSFTNRTQTIALGVVFHIGGTR